MQLAPNSLDRPICPEGGRHASHTVLLRLLSAVPCRRYRCDRPGPRQRAEVRAYDNCPEGCCSCAAYNDESGTRQASKDNAADDEGSASVYVAGKRQDVETNDDEECVRHGTKVIARKHSENRQDDDQAYGEGGNQAGEVGQSPGHEGRKGGQTGEEHEVHDDVDILKDDDWHDDHDRTDTGAAEVEAEHKPRFQSCFAIAAGH
jgi:hypothetical protein